MNIKDYKDKEINMYIIGIIFIYIFVTNSFQIQHDKIVYINEVITTILSSGVIYIFAYLADAIVSSYFKDKIIYLFGMKTKPGECIFSEIKDGCKDDRIYKDKVLEKYKEIYKSMPKDKKERKKYENSCWYGIYSKYRNEKMIEISNREYLISRDFVFITLALLILYLIFVFFKVTILDNRLIILLSVLIIINLISANIKAKRFVYNVIALDLNK